MTRLQKVLGKLKKDPQAIYRIIVGPKKPYAALFGNRNQTRKKAELIKP